MRSLTTLALCMTLLLVGGPRAASAQTVYWDVTHGTYGGYNIAGSYSTLAGQLTTAGYTVQETSVGLDVEDLSNVDIIVIAATNTWNSAYTAAEVAAIEAFVANGGGLLILADQIGLSATGYLQPVATAFGVTVGLDVGSTTETVWSTHPIAAGVSTVSHFEAGALTATAPSVVVGEDSTGRVLSTAASYQRGKVVVMGDVNPFLNGDISGGDNALFAQNIFDWLAEACQTEISATLEAAGANCAEGGLRVDVFCDGDGDGMLDSGEEISTEYVCNGATGADGHDTLIHVTTEAAGTHCANGGQRVDSGMDDNDNGMLDATEVEATAYVCDGTDGMDGTDGTDGTNGTDGANALTEINDEPAGASCAAGGLRIDVGLDTDGDGTLSAGEITDTDYLCHGEDGADGSGGCATGGAPAGLPAALLLLGFVALWIRRRRR